MHRRRVWSSRALTAVALGIVASVAVSYAPVTGGSDPHAGHRGPIGHLGHIGHLVVPAEAAEPTMPVLPRTGWTATASDAQTGDGAANAIDGSRTTLWHSQWSPALALPHWIRIDMGTVQAVAGLDYQPRDPAQCCLNGTIGQFRVETSANGTAWAVAATGTWANDATTKRVTFATVNTRYVRLTGLSESGNRGPWTSVAELNLLGPATAAAPVAVATRTGWTATASDAQTGNGAANVLDGSRATLWHSQWSPARALPHWVRVDTGASRTIAGLEYLPRDPALCCLNGTIGQYRIETSTNGTAWTIAAAGTWADNSATKRVLFAPVTARYVRLTGLTEAGNRGPWTSVAELNLLVPATAPPVTTVPGGGVLAPLVRTGWTATASDAETAAQNGAAANVLDGATATIWHSVWSGTPAPLPHWLTIDTGAVRSLGALRYTPRQDADPNGRIGAYTVTLSNDGVTWTAPVAQGTWADDASGKVATFDAVYSARYVRLTATTEAGNRGPWSSAAEIDLLGPGSGAQGAWSAGIGFPLVPAAAALLPNGKVLLWSAYSTTNFGGDSGYTQAALYDPTTGAVTQRTITNTQHDMFCPGVSILPDGRLVVTGGSSAAKTSVYDYRTDSWSNGPALNVARGYQGQATLADGSVFTLGGSWSGGRGGKVGEVWNPAGGGWRTLTGVTADAILTTNDPEGIFRQDNHAWFFAVSGGRLFHAGPSARMNWITTAGAGSITSAGTRADAPDQMNGVAVQYDVDRFLIAGGSTAYQNVAATNRAYTVDVRGATPVSTRVGDLAAARAFANAVVLPDGQVLLFGGQQMPVPFTDTTATLTPELWNPTTGRFTTMAPAATPRTYHSMALLLPDGRVLTGGGGLCGGCATNHLDGEIFTPPYLLNADGTLRSRPVITAAPAAATAGSTVAVTTDRAVASFSLVRYGEATHSVNNSQRRVPVTVSSSAGTTYQLALPGDRGVLLPGPYLLFALDANGTPSVAATVMVS